MAVGAMPPAEVEVDAGVVRLLLTDQRPDLAEEKVELLAQGWDNFSFRVGDLLVARLPRRGVAVPLLHNEARWLPTLAPDLPLPIPTPVFLGEPGHGYPWPWALVPLFRGEPAAMTDHLDQDTCARQLAGFLRALHRPAPDDAPENPYRGVPLRQRDAAVVDRIESLGDVIDRSAVQHLWSASLLLPDATGPRRWLHGDLHPSNILVSEGLVSAVIDFGDITGGDPATDLAIGWMLFDETRRSLFRAEYGDDDALWDRARGWALALALAYLGHSADSLTMGSIGERTLAEVLRPR